MSLLLALLVRPVPPEPPVNPSVELLGGGPGGPSRETRRDKTSYWYRLLSPPVQHKLEALEPEVVEVIEALAVEETPTQDPQAEMQRALDNLGFAYKQAYKEIYLELVAEMRQAQEDEQVAQIMALLL